MLLAESANGERISPARSGQRAICPGCRGEVIGKCGAINVWHWQHLVGADCDPWAERISEWHIGWQKYLKDIGAEIEVPISKNGQTHRADAILPNGVVVELQHSNISVDEIRERETFYDRMIWVFDIREAYEEDRFLLRDKGKFDSFRWKHAQKSIAFAAKPVRLDLGEGMVFQLKKIHVGPPCGGWGVLKFVEDIAFGDYV